MIIKEKFFDYTLLALLMVVFLFSVAICSVEIERVKLSRVEVAIELGDSVQFVTKQEVESLVNSDSLRGLWRYKVGCNSFEIERLIRKNPYIASAQVYASSSGVLSVDIEQKQVLFRIVTGQGDDCYIDSDFNPLLTSKNFVANVPIVSCSREVFRILTKNEKKVKKDNNYLHNLCNFVKLVESDGFWSKMVVQTSISNSFQLKITPRIGTHTATICNLDRVEEAEVNLKRLKLFYDKVLSPKNEWGLYSHIDVDYKTVVVAKK